MKLTNFLKIILTAFFVVGILSITNAGQKEVVPSSDTGAVKVEPDISKTAPKKVVPQKVEPKAVPGGTSVAPKKKKVEIKQPQKPTPRLKCNGKVVTILGTSGDDVLNGTRGPDVIHGLGGDDIIRGMGGNDTICGGDGDDKLDGGDGNDFLDGGKGNDVCINGPSGKGILVAPKNCENKKLPPTVGISPKTQRKPAVTSGGFVPPKPAQKAQLETQKQFEAKKRAFVVQPDTMKPRSGDTSMGRTMSKPSSTVTFQTHLSVKLPGDKWGTEYKETEWQYLKFRWRTPIGDIPINGKWEISMSPYFDTVIFDGDAGRISESGQYQWFFIDFKNVAEQYANLNRVYVRVVPITESKLYSPSLPVKIAIIKPGPDTVFTVYPKIDATLGNPGWDTVSPEGKLYIMGNDFGTEKGHIFIYGVGFPNGKLELDPVVWESGSRVNGKVPHVTGIPDQDIEVEVVTKEGLASNRHEHMFLGIRETRVLGYNDAAVKNTRCLYLTSEGGGGELDRCDCVHIDRYDSSFCGWHRNPMFDWDYREGYDNFKVELKNGWNIVDVQFETILSSDNERLDGPVPNWKYGMTLWEPKFHWEVSPADSVRYWCTITIEGPKGVPYH